MAKPKDAWREEFVSPGEFKCACGCELQLSKGDLADAVRVANSFNGIPRTSGVRSTTFPGPVGAPKREKPEPSTSGECPKCGELVSLPTFAAQLLSERGADWPICEDCRSGRQLSLAPNPRAYWE